MIDIKRKPRSMELDGPCVMCGNGTPATMTIKAPMATPIRVCDNHQRRGWAMGEQAVDMNLRALEMMANPDYGPLMFGRKARPVGMRAATDAQIARYKAAQEFKHQDRLRAAELATLKAELAQVQREKAELEAQEYRERQDRAVAEAHKLARASRNALMESLKAQGIEVARQQGAMTRIRDRRRIRE